MKAEDNIPPGWRELNPREIITTDDRVFQWNQGPWKDVGGEIIGERYSPHRRPTNPFATHWVIIRQTTQTEVAEIPPAQPLRVQFDVPSGVDDPELQTVAIMLQALYWRLKDDPDARKRVVDYISTRA